MKDIVLFGIQGSGKGTQCRYLMEHYDQQLVYFESGTILRALKSNDNAIGNYVKSLIDKGIYLPDEFLIGLIDLMLQTLTPGQALLLDGFPRRIGQMQMYLERIAKLQRSLVVIHLDLDKDLAIGRLSKRRVCPKCSYTASINPTQEVLLCPKCSIELIQRVDDTPEAILHRIQQYEQETVPVLDYFRAQGWLYTVSADQDPEKVFQDILRILKS